MTRSALNSIGVLLLLAVTLCGMSHETYAESRPNIVLLYADDAGYADFGFQETTDDAMVGLTPHIDSIAATGARFTSGYMSGCVCSPSRAGMMTGRYQQRFGHELNIPPGYMKGGLPLSESTVADRLQALGYATGIVGKWHLGYPDDYHPNQRGFQHFYGLLQGSRGYFPIKNVSPHRVVQENGTPTEESGYVTDRFGEGAVQFIEKNKDKPFFLYLSFTSPHGPMHAKESDLLQLGHIKNERRRTYAGMVKCMDDNIGLVLDTLKQHELLENTLIIFTNDNGGQTSTGAVNTPLRGKKGTLWEGGIRVPMAMQWAGKIAAGTVIDEPVIALDFLPTFLQAAGGKVNQDWKLDGVNLLPRITGAVDTLPERPLYWRAHGPQRDSAIRLGDWKLLLPDHKASSQAQLYNLSEDIGEKYDLANDHPEVALKLQSMLSAWERQLIDPLWTSRPNQRQSNR